MRRIVLKQLLMLMTPKAAPTVVRLILDDAQASMANVPQPSTARGSITTGSKLTRTTGGTGKFGTSYFDLLCDDALEHDFLVALPGSDDWPAGIGSSGDFTFSSWLKQGPSYGSPGAWWVLGVGTGDNCFLKVNDNVLYATLSDNIEYGSGTSFSSATDWKHFACVRQAGKVSTWYDGARKINQQSDATDFDALTRIFLGSSAGTSRGSVLIDDWVLMSGAKWNVADATITVPTASLQT